MNEALTLTFETGRVQTGIKLDHYQFFQDELRHTGFRHFAFCVFCAGSGLAGSSEVLLSNTNEDIIRPVINLFDFRLSPLAQRMGTDFEPFHWRVGATGQVADMELSGYCLPVKSSSGHTGCLIAFDGDGSGERNFSRLTFAAHELFTQLTRSPTPDQTLAMGLTLRELDCLRWTAEGKTSSEIAAIIKLSEHTVNHYLIAAARKLDCVNRVQAVAKALRLGLFH